MGHRKIVVLLSSTLFVAGCSADAGQVGQVPESVSSSSESLITGSDRFTYPVPADYNGDGINDVMIATLSGSYEYTGLRVGGFTPNVYVRHDLTIQNSNYYSGDFNGDHISDLIIQTRSGAYEYLGMTTGGFATANAWSNIAWNIDSVMFAVSDFNGDGVSDFIVTTNSGSSEYLGVQSPYLGASTKGTYTGPVWSSNNFPNPLTENNYPTFYPGDFNNDGVGDVIATSAAGSFQYLGVKTTGGFTGPSWTRTDLPARAVTYYPGDYNGDGFTDVIIMDASGSYEYFGQKSGGFTAGSWHSSAFTLGSSIMQPGDYNNDGKTDILIANSAASFVYTGQAGGGFIADAWKSPLYNVGNMPAGGFTRGDFNGDGFADAIITSTAGSFEYTGETVGYKKPILTGPVYSRTDLVAPETMFFPSELPYAVLP
jgi:hypothetical protein